MAQAPSPSRRSLGLCGLGLAISLVLSGCGSRLGIPRVLYIAVGTNADQTISAELVEEFNDRLRRMQEGFRQIHPNTRFQLSLYPEEKLEAAIRMRSRAGLGPDLIYANGDTALRLMREGLVDPYPASTQLLHLFNPEELARLRSRQGALAGLPVILQTQMACFNREAMDQAPASLDALLATGARGHPIGLSVDIFNLFWTAGSLGAVTAVDQVVEGRPPSAAAMGRIERWLDWLQQASNQQWVTFYANQETLEAEFIARRLDWIPCRSTALTRLRQKLGPALGVGNLPAGPRGPASPVNRVRVFALGTSSSATGRERAIAFIRFSVNPLMQRQITMASQNVLPANRFVKVPVHSSNVLQAMVTAAEQGNQVNKLNALLHTNDPRIAKSQQLITQLVFGEVNPAEASRALVQILRPHRSAH